MISEHSEVDFRFCLVFESILIIDVLTEWFQSATPFLHRMSVTEEEEFVDEFLELFLDMTMERNVLNSNGKIDVIYKVMTAFAEKS